MDCGHEKYNYCDYITDVPNVHRQYVTQFQIYSTNMQDLFSKTKLHFKMRWIGYNIFIRENSVCIFPLTNVMQAYNFAYTCTA